MKMAIVKEPIDYSYAILVEVCQPKWEVDDEIKDTNKGLFMLKLLKKIFNIFKYEDLDSGYVWVSLIGIIVRYVALGFLCRSLISSMGITYGILISIGAFIVNWFIEYPLYKFTYLETGIFYESGRNAIVGSALYLVFYLLNCGVFLIIQWFYNNWIYYACLGGYIAVVLIVRGIVGIFR